MIRVERYRQPEFYYSEKFKKHKDELYRLYSSLKINDQRRNFFFPLRGEFSRHIRNELRSNFRGKCAYCESIIESGVIDLFRPRIGARDLNRKVSDGHYWWLSLEWDNQYYCCQVCNRNKGSWFPVEGDRCKLLIGYPDVYKEDSILIDPCYDTPEEHLQFLPDGEVKPLSLKGDVTINLLKLNRNELIERRAQAYQDTLTKEKLLRLSNRSGDLIQIKEEISGILEGKSDASHIAMRRLALMSKTNITQYIPAKIAIDKPQYIGKSKSVKNSYVTSIKIKNFKSIKSLSLDVSQNAGEMGLAPWTVFLGENGLGKSSLLQAICLGLVDPNYFEKFINIKRLVNKKVSEGSTIISLDNQTNIITRFSGNKIVDSNYDVIPNYVIAYGSTRLPKQEGIKTDNGTTYFKIKNLFDHTAAIKDAQKWLLNIKSEKAFASAARIIKLSLSLDNSYKLKRKDGNIFFQRGANLIPLDHMSDGYKSTISLIIDIISVLNKGMDNFEDIEGIVFIDELELHLHPRWKMRFINSFRTAFPKIQVFATTHDPLCLRGLYKGEVVLLREVGNNVKILTDLPDVSLFNSEQLLKSEFFGLSSTMDPDLELLFDRYYLLKSKKRLTESQKLELQELASKIPDSIPLGDSLRDELILQAIDTLVANQYKSNTLKTRDDLKKSTRDFIANILNK